MAEATVPLGTQAGGQQVRNLLVTTLINSVPTQVLMQVISVSDQDGKVLNLSTDLSNELLTNIRTEMRISNQLFADLFSEIFSRHIDLDAEYRNDKDFLT